jgi:hypothetical protein
MALGAFPTAGVAFAGTAFGMTGGASMMAGAPLPLRTSFAFGAALTAGVAFLGTAGMAFAASLEVAFLGTAGVAFPFGASLEVGSTAADLAVPFAGGFLASIFCCWVLKKEEN